MTDDHAQTKSPKAKTRNQKIIIIMAGVLLLMLGIGLLFVNIGENECELQTPNQSCLNLEQATTAKEQEKGLSGRTNLKTDSGMLFVFDKPAVRCFWMKDMQFPIDIIWLDQNKKVMTIKENTSPDTYPESFCSDKPAQYVLETNAGQAKILGIQKGSQLQF